METKLVIDVPLPYEMSGAGIKGTYQLLPRSIRISEVDRIIIDKAAEARGLSFNAFVRCAAVEVAKAVNALEDYDETR